MASNRSARVRKKQKLHCQFLIFLMLLHCSYITKSYKLNNNKTPKNNKKRDYNTGVSGGTKKF